jgi:hypothetical protein
MFERFRARYVPLRDPSSTPGSPWLDPRLIAAQGYQRFAVEFAGTTFGDGVYRVHDDVTGPMALGLIAEAFPEFAARVCPFSYDWLGRQFVVDAGRVDGGQPQILLIEPGTGEALEIPLSFSSFHNEELLDYADAALAIEFFEAWSTANPAALPLERDQCVGYKVPLFLGGQDILENLELADLDVYWSICGQLRRGAIGLPPGTSVNDVSGH